MKNKMYGWQKVYGFSMKQRLKGKGFRITMAVLFIVALLSLPVMSLFGKKSKSEATEKSPVTMVYVKSNTMEALNGALSRVLGQSDIYKDVSVSSAKADDDFTNKAISRDPRAVYMDITIANGVNYQAYYEGGDQVSKKNVEHIVDYISGHTKEMLMYMKGLDENTIQALSKDYSSEIQLVSAGSNGAAEIVEDKEGLGFDEYGFSYALLMASMLLIMIGSSSVADAVVTEKSTRVIEYLLINVKPMVIVFGKILSAVTTVLLELVAVVVGFGCSVVANGLLFPSADGTFAMPQLVESFLNGGMFAKASVLGIVISVLIFLLGVVFYGFVAGIAGASVSRVEDTQEGMKLFTMVAIIGAYLALFLIISESTAGSNWGPLTNVVYLLPLSAPFIMPEYLILGKVSLAMGGLSLAIMVICIILMLILVSNIYGALIYHRAAPLNLKDIIGISKAERRHK